MLYLVGFRYQEDPTGRRLKTKINFNSWKMKPISIGDESLQRSNKAQKILRLLLMRKISKFGGNYGV